MSTFVLSGDIRDTTVAAIRASLTVVLGPAVSVHHDIDFDWSEPGVVDITFESSESLAGGNLDYTVRGTIDTELESAVARVRRLAEALDSRGIAYRFELDHDDGDTVVIQSTTFPGY